MNTHREAAIDITLEHLGAAAEGATIVRDADKPDMALIVTESALYTVQASTRTNMASITRALFVGGYDHLALYYPKPESHVETVYLTREAAEEAARKRRIATDADKRIAAKSPCYCDYTFHPNGC